ncbi:helix-turn-helix domain-containing protein [Leifsonia shinshuensis]
MSEILAPALQEALATELRAAQGVAELNVRAWARRAGITHDSLYRVLRNRRPVSVVELIMLCRAIDEDPLDLISRAAQRAGQPLRGSSRAAEIIRANRARLALEAAGLSEDLDVSFLKARTGLQSTGHLLSAKEWEGFLEGRASAATTAALGVFLDVPSDYLAGLEDEAAVKVGSQLRFARSMRDVGVTQLAARSLDQLEPDEIEAVETAIREFIDEEEDHEK